MAAEHTAGLLGDTHFWVLMATVVFAIVAFKKGRAPLTAMLDKRTERIRAELDEAERLRIEAQDLLSDCQKKHRDAVHASEKIVENARQTAERIRKDAELKLEENLKRKETQLLARISRAESAAIEDLRHQAADIAARGAEALLEETLAKRGQKLVEDSVQEIRQRMH